MKTSRHQGLGVRATSGGWVRARRPEHKQARCEAILDAARRLLDSAGVEGTTLSEIARTAEISKANCYRYFESREAILLTVILDETRAWSSEVNERLRSLAEPRSLDAAVDIFVTETIERPRLCMLFSSLWSVLERNVSAESVTEFKRDFLEISTGSVDSIATALALSADDAYAFLSFFFYFIAGSWPAANPSPLVAEVLEQEEFAGQCVNFESTLRAHTRLTLGGVLANGR